MLPSDPAVLLAPAQAVAARPTGMAVVVIVMQEVLEGEAEEITATTTLIDTAQQTLVVAVAVHILRLQDILVALVVQALFQAAQAVQAS